MKTKAAILAQSRQPLEIDEVEVPALGFGQVLVEIKTTRICGSQIGEIDAVKGPDRYLPHLLGHEAFGIVRELGPEVRHVKEGDSVVCHWRKGIGINASPPKYSRKGTTVNAGQIATFAEFAVISENRLTPVPKDLPKDWGALLADTLTTGFGSVNRIAQVSIGQSVIVIGAGGIGSGVIAGASLAGAFPIVAADIHSWKLEKACKIGATHSLDTSFRGLMESWRALDLGTSVDVVFDLTGRPEVIEEAWEILSPNGILVEVGVMPVDRKLAINTLPMHFGKRLTATEGGDSQPGLDIPRYVRMMQSGRLSPDGFVSHRGSLEQVNELIDKMRNGEVFHAVIDFQ